MYSISIILFLKNNLTNICCEVSQIRMNLWMIYICRSDLESTVREDRKKVNVLYIVDWNNKRSVIAVNHFRNFKGIWLMVVTMEKYLSRKKKLMFEIEKKESQKLKSLSKFTIYIRWTRALSTFSSKQNQNSASLKLQNDVFTKTWKLAIAAYLKKSGFPARENFSEDTIYVCK